MVSTYLLPDSWGWTMPTVALTGPATLCPAGPAAMPRLCLVGDGRSPGFLWGPWPSDLWCPRPAPVLGRFPVPYTDRGPARRQLQVQHQTGRARAETGWLPGAAPAPCPPEALQMAQTPRATVLIPRALQTLWVAGDWALTMWSEAWGSADQLPRSSSVPSIAGVVLAPGPPSRQPHCG